MDAQTNCYGHLTAMNTLTETLSNLMGNAELTRIVAVALLATAIFLIGLVILLVLARYFDPLKRRLDTLTSSTTATKSATQRFVEQLDNFSYTFIPSDQSQLKSTTDRLSMAGYRSSNRLMIYYFIRSLLMIILPVLILLMHPLFPNTELQKVYWYAAMAGVSGLILPSYYLDKKIAKQQRILRNGLPDAIDLLVVCTEAGLGLNAAMLRVAEVIIDIHPALAQEFFSVNAEMRAGVDRTIAMSNMAIRTGLEDIKSLFTVLDQSMRFGTSIAQTLRVYSEEFRDKRMQKADEEAAKLSSKMLFPLIICIFPGFFIVALGPAVMKFIAAFSAM
jgi:tight adherence protein C